MQRSIGCSIGRPLGAPGRSSLAGLALVAALAATAGCGTGSDATTRTRGTTADSGFGTLGSISVRNAFLAEPETGRYRTGADARLYAYIYNSGDSADRLVFLSSPEAGSVQITRSTEEGEGGAASASPSGSASPSAPSPSAPSPSASAPVSTSAAPTPSGSASATAPASPSASPSPSALPTLSGLVIPARGSSPTGVGGAVTLLLVDVREELTYGEAVDVTLRFERAGELTLKVPVALPEDPGPRPTAAHEEE